MTKGWEHRVKATGHIAALQRREA